MLRASLTDVDDWTYVPPVAAQVPDCGDHFDASSNWSEKSVSPVSLDFTVRLSYDAAVLQVDRKTPPEMSSGWLTAPSNVLGTTSSPTLLPNIFWTSQLADDH